MPVNLLDRWRCGLRIAVNVIISPETRNLDPAGVDRRSLAFDKFLGFKSVLGASWELLGWRHGATEAETAEILIEPDTRQYSGYDFGACEGMIEAGRRAAEEKIKTVRLAISSLVG